MTVANQPEVEERDSYSKDEILLLEFRQKRTLPKICPGKGW